MVKALLPERANQPFRMANLPWRAGRNRPVTNARGTKPAGENRATDRVSIPNQYPAMRQRRWDCSHSHFGE